MNGQVRDFRAELYDVKSALVQQMTMRKNIIKIHWKKRIIVLLYT